MVMKFPACRNATINEDANCTHYLDDDEGDGLGLQHERQAGAESTEEEDGDGEGEDEDSEQQEDDDKAHNVAAATETPSQKAVDEHYASACDACDEQQSVGEGKVPGATNTCWSAAEDDCHSLRGSMI